METKAAGAGRGNRLFLFDVDGTLVHVGGAGRQALERAFLETFDLRDRAGLAADIRFDGNTDRVILEEMRSRGGIDAARFAAAAPALQAAYLQALRERVAEPGRGRVLPGVRELLDELQARGDALALMTGNSREGARAKLEPFDLYRYFASGAFGSEHEDRRALAALAHRRMQAWSGRGFPQDRVVVVGDSVMDVRAGRSQGFRTVAVLTGWTDRERLAAERPDLLLDDLTGLLERIDPPPDQASP